MWHVFIECQLCVLSSGAHSSDENKDSALVGKQVDFTANDLELTGKIRYGVGLAF